MSSSYSWQQSVNGNQNFSQNTDTNHDSKVLKGILNNNVFPLSFRVIKAQANVKNTQGPITGLAFYDTTTNEQVYLAPGQQILYAAIESLSTFTSLGAPAFNFGLSITPANGLSPVVDVSFADAITLSQINSGVSFIPGTLASNSVLGNTALFLAMDITTATLTSGGLVQAVLILV